MTREEALDILGSYMTTNEKECWTPFDEGVHYAIQAIEKINKIEQIDELVEVLEEYFNNI